MKNYGANIKALNRVLLITGMILLFLFVCCPSKSKKTTKKNPIKPKKRAETIVKGQAKKKRQKKVVVYQVPKGLKTRFKVNPKKRIGRLPKLKKVRSRIAR